MSTLSDVGTKVGSEFKADRARITTVENDKVDKVVGKQLSTEDYSTAEKSKLAGIEDGAEINVVTSVASKVGDVTLDKTDVGLANVDNTADINKDVLSATKLSTSRNIELSGGVSGTVAFDGSSDVNVVTTVDSVDASAITSGTIDADRLPSYVDDVLEYADLATFPVVGETGKIYIALDTNKTYRWSGSTYVYITSGAVDSVAGKTGVVTLVKDDVGLSLVDNTADASKNVLSATKWTTARTIALAGDITGSASVDGSANVTITTTVQPNSVALGTDTTGNYVAGVTAGQGITISGTAGEGWSPTIALSALDLTLFPTSNFKKSVKVATTANITLSGVQTIDGISVVAGDRVLVKNQTTASQNGIYIVNASTWTRSVAADGVNEIDSAVVGVDQGTTNGGRFFKNTFKTTDTVGTTAMPWYEVATTSSTVSSANTLATARTVQTNLGSTTSASFNGSANITPGVIGTLPVSNGGTGATTLTGLVKGNGTSAMSSAVAGTDYVVPSGSITGNASTATKLATAITINGVSFNGTADIVAPTNLTIGTRTTTSVPIESSSGTNASIPVATTTLAGVMSSADKVKLDGIAVGAEVNVATNLGITAGTTAGPIVTSSTGTNATLPTATASASGVVTTGNQTWAGVKTFSSNPISTATQSTAVNALTRKDYVDTALASKANQSTTYTKTEIDNVNLLRADKYLAAQNVVNMSYNLNGKLEKVQYNNATDVDYEVLTYNLDGKLSNVAHYVGSVLKGNTVLSYVNGKLISAPFTAV